MINPIFFLTCYSVLLLFFVQFSIFQCLKIICFNAFWFRRKTRTDTSLYVFHAYKNWKLTRFKAINDIVDKMMRQTSLNNRDIRKSCIRFMILLGILYIGNRKSYENIIDALSKKTVCNKIWACLQKLHSSLFFPFSFFFTPFLFFSFSPKCVILFLDTEK